MVKLMTNDGGTTTTAPPSEYGDRDWILGYRPSPTPGRELVLRPKNDKEGGGGDYDDDKNDEDKEMHHPPPVAAASALLLSTVPYPSRSKE